MRDTPRQSSVASGGRPHDIVPVPPVPAGLACLALAALAVGLDAALLPQGVKLTREGGAVELMSALFYLVALGVFLVLARSRRAWLWPVPVLLGAMFLREFDADKRFTSEGLLSTKIITYDTSLAEKALGAAVMGTLALMLIFLLLRTLRPFLSALLRFSEWAVWVAAALVLMVFTKSIDGLARKLEPFGVPVSEDTSRLAGVAEEYLELGIPILLLMAVLAGFGDREGTAR